MFKSLLRTLPSLSGNFALACPLDYIQKDSKDEFTVNIRSAKIVPLQNGISNPTLTEISLLMDKYEYDISRYYKNLSDSLTFYESRKSANVNQLVGFSLVDNNDFVSNICTGSRDTDYEFGVKRISHAQHGYQFMFYAPFYIDDFNSLPETFEFTMIYKDRYFGVDNVRINKKVKINIKKKTHINYLRNYLERYISKIDKNVLNINSYYRRGIYYGIDVANGGLQAYKYDNISRLYSQHINIMDFDEIICKGFQETKQVMRQVIPMAFIFNIDDFLTDNEKMYLYGKTFTIRGHYSTNGYVFPFNDFHIDYRSMETKSRIYNKENGQIETITTDNVFNLNYGGFKEAYLKDIFAKNKVTPYITKWKMLQSKDEQPYIINANYSFTSLDNGSYGEYPIINTQNIVPTIIDSCLYLPNSKQIIKDANKFTNTTLYRVQNFINKFNTSWYNIASIINDDHTINESDIVNENRWVEVINDKAYFKGVYYNVNELINQYNHDNNDNITDVDYFGVFINMKTSIFDTANIDKIKLSKYTISKNKNQYNVSVNNTLDDLYMYEQRSRQIKKTWWTEDEDGEPVRNKIKSKTIPHYHNPYLQLFNVRQNSTNNAYIELDKQFIEDPQGDYINLTNLSRLNSYILEQDAKLLINNKDIFEETPKSEVYIKLDLSYETAYNLLIKLKEALDKCDSESDEYEYFDKIFYSSKYSGTKLKLSIFKKEDSDPNDLKFSVFYKTNVVSLNEFLKKYKESNSVKFSEEYVSLTNVYKEIKKTIDIDELLYEYVPMYIDGNTTISSYMQKKKIKDKIAFTVWNKDCFDLSSSYNFSNYYYVDSYNLKKFINKHNDYIKIAYKNDQSKMNEWIIDKNILDVTPYKYAYIKMDSQEMAKEYAGKLGKNEKLNKEGDSDFYILDRQYRIINNKLNIYCENFDKDQEYDGFIKSQKLYYKKKIYLLTGELFKLFHTQSQIAMQLYILKPDYWFESNYGDKDDDNLAIEVNNVTETKQIVPEHSIYKYLFEDNVYWNRQTMQIIYNSFVVNNLNKSYKTLNIIGYNGTSLKTPVYTNRSYDNDMFVHIGILSDYALEMLKTRKNGKGRPITVARYSEYKNSLLDNSEIKIVEHKGKKYMYILMDLHLDNSSLSFNFDNLFSTQIISSINNEKITEDNIRALYVKYHEYITPFIRINLFKSFLEIYGSYVIKPENISLKQYYKVAQESMFNKDNLYSYKLLKNSSYQNNVSISRYFTDCTPYIVEVNRVDNFYSRPMMRLDDVIKNNHYQFTNNIEKSFIIENIDIYNANKTYIKDPLVSKTDFQQNEYFEYKHFNDNKMYNLEKEFEITYPEIVSESQLTEIKNTKFVTSENKTEWIYKNNSIEYHLFKEYMLRHYKSNNEINYLDENSGKYEERYDFHFLFLFNKYMVTQSTVPVKADLLNNEIMYVVKYNYELK